jgi:hypothetical protein
MTERFLVHILSPVYRVIEDDTIHDPRMGTSLNHLNLPVVDADFFRRTQDSRRRAAGASAGQGWHRQVCGYIQPHPPARARRTPRAQDGACRKGTCAQAVRRAELLTCLVQMTTHPAAAIKRKQERNVNKKDSRKRKNAAFRFVLPQSSLFIPLTLFLASNAESWPRRPRPIDAVLLHTIVIRVLCLTSSLPCAHHSWDSSEIIRYMYQTSIMVAQDLFGLRERLRTWRAS